MEKLVKQGKDNKNSASGKKTVIKDPPKSKTPQPTAPQKEESKTPAGVDLEEFWKRKDPTLAVFIRGDKRSYTVKGITKSMTPFAIL